MSGQHKTELAMGRRALLQKGLLRLMRVHGYLSVSVKDICEAAGIPRRTFYHYYNGKDELLNAVIEDMMLPGFLAAMFDFQEDAEAVRQSFIRFFRYWEERENRERLRLLLDSGMESRLIAYATNWATTESISILHGSMLSEKHIRFARIIGTASFFALLFHWCKTGFKESAEELADFVVWFLNNPINIKQ